MDPISQSPPNAKIVSYSGPSMVKPLCGPFLTVESLPHATGQWLQARGLTSIFSCMAGALISLRNFDCPLLQ